MKWISRGYMLLLGISATTITATLLYYGRKLCKKNNNTDGKDPTVTSRSTTIQCKVPKSSVAAIIGRHGSVIKDIQSTTGVLIKLHKDDDIQSLDCLCSIQGSEENVCLAEAMIKNIIDNQPVIDTHEFFMPHKACKRIIGRGGETVQQIQSISGTKINIESNTFFSDPDAKRRIIIKGTTNQVETAINLIKDKVREEEEAQSMLEASYAFRMPRSELCLNNNVRELDNTSKFLLSRDDLMEVHVSAMITPNQFWVQVIGPGITALNKLVGEMTIYYNEQENRDLHVLKKIIPNQVVAARSSRDSCWYRAKIVDTLTNSQCKVCFLDYGDRVVISTNDLMELRTDMLSLRFQAVECSLANVKPLGKKWSDEACNKFAELTYLAHWKIIHAKVEGYEKRSIGYRRCQHEDPPIPCINLYNKNEDVNIGQTLISLGLAKSEKDILKTIHSILSQPKCDSDTNTSSTDNNTGLARVILHLEESEKNVSGAINSELNTSTSKSDTNALTLNIPRSETEANTPSNESDNQNQGPSSTSPSEEQSDCLLNEKKIPISGYAPADYENESDDSDEFEMG